MDFCMKGGYDILPNIMLVGAEQELSQTGKEHRLKEAIAPVAEKYDYIIIDTPPSLGVLTVNAFTVAGDILIPTTAGIFATTGINQLNETVRSVQRYCNPNVKITGSRRASRAAYTAVRSAIWILPATWTPASPSAWRRKRTVSSPCRPAAASWQTRCRIMNTWKARTRHARSSMHWKALRR